MSEANTTEQPAVELPVDFSLLLVLDPPHLDELRCTWPTWRAHRPELMQVPVLIVCDAVTCPHHDHEAWWRQQLGFVVRDNPSVDLIFSDWRPDLPQRERMLTEFIYAPQLIETSYYLKLDTDVVATGPGRWIEPEWFRDDPVFVASPWGYTKPAEHLETLDRWAAEIPDLQNRPAPERRVVGGVAKHARMISWLMFGNTEWTRALAVLFEPDSRMPVPSQDTTVHYIAARHGDHYCTARMNRYGWQHIGRGGERLKQAAAAALVPTGATA